MFWFIVLAIIVFFVSKSILRNKTEKKEEDKQREEIEITFSTNFPSYTAKQYSEEFVKQKNFQISKI